MKRIEIQVLERKRKHSFKNPYEVVELFEKEMAQFCGAPYAIACDSNTHAVELCLRYTQPHSTLRVPCRTYPSIPMTLIHINLPFQWSEEDWQGIYHFGREEIFDASLRLQKNMYLSSTYMCLSFQFKKRLAIGRGGMILTDNKKSYNWFKRAVHDGRTPGVLWKEDHIKQLGFHYYMTPDDAARGLLLKDELSEELPDLGGSSDYPDLRRMEVFREIK